MSSWGELAAESPNLAARGKSLLYRTGDGDALLVTVRGDEPPQAHPISLRIVGEGIYAFILPSPKLRDLEQDGRYALHAHFDPNAPDEFQIRGRARRLGETERAELARDWSWTVGDAPGFEFLIEEALLGERGADEWPPRYTTWKAPEKTR
jgi:hypothetical protein